MQTFNLPAFLAAPAYDLPATPYRDKRGELESLTRIHLFENVYATVRTYKSAATYNRPATLVSRVSCDTRNAPEGSTWESWGTVISFVRPSLLAHLTTREEKRGTEKNIRAQHFITLLKLQEWLQKINSAAALQQMDTAEFLKAAFKDNGEIA